MTFCSPVDLLWFFSHCTGWWIYYDTYHRGLHLILRPDEEWLGSQHATVGTDGQLLPARTFTFCNKEREKSQFHVAMWLII